MRDGRRFTPTSLSREIDRVLARHWPDVAVEAEVSQRHVPASGHCYFVLRDREATLSCVMWRSDFERSSFRPEVGKRVIAVGRLGLFANQSRYQLYARAVRPAGEGERAKKLEKIKARLEADGLLDPRRKRALPTAPRFVGVATSATGAALQDFLEVSRKRYPAARILLSPCTVQGPEAPTSVIRALELLAEDGRSEVMVVTRGGGAREDLAAFDDEWLARWVARAPVPVLSAVGHQVDDTILDLVADGVAPTPSAAAVAVLPDGAAWTQRVDEAAVALDGAVHRWLALRRERVEQLGRRLRSPSQRLELARIRRIELVERLGAAMARSVDRRRGRVEGLEGRLSALSPLGVLDRGYAIVRGPKGIVRDPDSVGSGDPLEIRVAGGSIDADVR